MQRWVRHAMALSAGLAPLPALAQTTPPTSTPAPPPAPDAGAPNAATPNGQVLLPGVSVTASQLDEARGSIQPSLGASRFDFTPNAIGSIPQGDQAPINQVILRAPGVAQDSFGQLHVRGDHGNLQYRLDGVQLPEGLSLFSNALTTQYAHKMSLITGALPAQYGFQTAGILDITLKSGTTDPGAEATMTGGSLRLAAARVLLWRQQRQDRLLRDRPVPAQRHRHREPDLVELADPRHHRPVARPGQGHRHHRRPDARQLHRRRLQCALPDSQQSQPDARLHRGGRVQLQQRAARPAAVGEHLFRHRVAAEAHRRARLPALGLHALLQPHLPARPVRRPDVQRHRAVVAPREPRGRHAGRRQLEGHRRATRCAAASWCSASMRCSAPARRSCRSTPPARRPATSRSASPRAATISAGCTASTCRTNGSSPSR